MAREYSTIAIHRPDGSVLCDAILTEGSVAHFQLMESFTIRLSFVEAEPIALTRGCYINHPIFGKFILGSDDKHKPRYDKSSNGYQYNITFDAFYYDWNRKLYVHNPKKGAHQSTWTLTGDIAAHMSMFVKILNESGFYYEEDDEKIKFTCNISYQSGDPKEDIGMPNHDIKTITYDGLHILDALSTICEQFETEWFVNHSVIEIGRKENRGEEYKDLTIGSEGCNCERMDSSSSKDEYANRIYLFGSTRNVPSRYRKDLIMQVNDISDEAALDMGLVINLKSASGETIDSYGHTGVFGSVYNPTTHSYAWDLAYYYPTKTFYKDKVWKTKIADFTPELSNDPSLMENRRITIKNFSAFVEHENIKSASARIELRSPSGSVEDVMCSTIDNNGNILMNADKTYSLRCTGGARYSLYFVLEYPLAVGTGELSDENKLNKYFYGTSRIVVNTGGQCEISVASPLPSSTAIVFRDKIRPIKPDMFREAMKTIKAAETKDVSDSVGLFPKQGEQETKATSFSNIYSGDLYYGKLNIIPDFTVSCARCKSLQCRLVITATSPTGEVVKSVAPSFNESYTTSDYFTEIKYNIFEKLTGGESPFVMNLDEIENSGTKFRLSIKLEITATIDQYTPVKIDGTISIQNLNACVNTKIRSVAIEDGDPIYEIDATINPYYTNNRSEAASYIYLKAEDVCEAMGISTLPPGFKITDLFTHFTVLEVLSAQVPLPYYTDEEAIDGKVMNYKKRLMLNKSKYPNNYMQLEGVNDEDVVEQVVVAEDIYPKKVLDVIDVEVHTTRETVEYDDDGEEIKGEIPHYFIFTAAGEFPFIKEMTYNQDQMKVIFQSGLLAGLEFDINYDSEKDGRIRWELVSTNSDNFWLPNETLCPQVDDKLILFNYDPSYMEDLLVASAEAELEEYGKRYLARVGVEAGTINCTLMSDYAVTLFDDEDNIGIKIGDRVNLVNPGVFANGRKSRIIGFDIKLDIPYDSPQLICGESGQYSLLADYANKIENMSNTAAYGPMESVGGGGAVGIVQMDAIPSPDTAFSSEATNNLYLRKNKDDVMNGKLTTRGLSVEGKQFVNGQSIVQGTQEVNGKSTINGDQEVAGNATFAGNAGSKVFNPGLLGSGWKIKENGHAEMDSLSLRKFLEVPELRYNRTTVLTGVQWHTNGAGIIEEVYIDRNPETGNYLNSGVVKLKLEDGEVGAVAAHDLCMGIYHNEDGGNETTNYDGRNGDFKMKGFQTIYFRVDYICDENGDKNNPDSKNQYFHYSLRENTESWTGVNHPLSGMNFAAYANPSNETRQCCVYSTTDYTIMLVGMVDWNYTGNNISLIEGNLNGFSIPAIKLVDGEWVEYMQELNGYGLAFGNAYMWGKITQFTRDAYLVSQQIFYYASDKTQEEISEMWESKELTIDDFSEEPLSPSEDLQYVYQAIKYKYSNESESVSDPALYAMYGVAGSDGYQPNMFGYDTEVRNDFEEYVITDNGFAAYVNAQFEGSEVRLSNINIQRGNKYAVSFILEQDTFNVDIEVVIGGASVGQKTFTPSMTGKRVTYTGVCGSDNKDIVIRLLVTNYIDIESLVTFRDFKVENANLLSGDSTPFNGLASDSIIQQPNIILNSGSFVSSMLGENTDVIRGGYNGQDIAHISGYIRQEEKFLVIPFNTIKGDNICYTLSWMQKGQGSVYPNVNFGKCGRVGAVNGEAYIDNWNHRKITLTDDWTLNVVTFYKKVYSEEYADIAFYNSTGNVNIYITMPKLEVCKKNTAWQLAEEDKKGDDGKDGLNGAQPNLYGYDSVLADEYGCIHTNNGIICLNDGFAAVIIRSGMHLEAGKKYIVSFDYTLDCGSEISMNLGDGEIVSIRVDISDGNASLVDSENGYIVDRDGNYIATPGSSIRVEIPAECGSDMSISEFSMLISPDRTSGNAINVKNFKVELDVNNSGRASLFYGLAEDFIVQAENLIDNTGTFKGVDTYECDIIKDAFNGMSALYLNARAPRDNRSVYTFFIDNLDPKSWYVLSWYQKGQGNSTLLDWMNNPIIGVFEEEEFRYIESQFSTSVDFPLTDRWERHTIKFKGSWCYNLNLRMLCGNDSVMYFAMPKIEQCEKPTAWQASENDRKGEDGIGTSVDLSSETIYIPLSSNGELLEDVNTKIYTDVFKGTERIFISYIALGSGYFDDYFDIRAVFGQTDLDENGIEISSKDVEFWDFTNGELDFTVFAEDSEGNEISFYKTIKLVKNVQGRDGISPLSLSLDVNTIVFPTLDGNIADGAIARSVMATIYSGSKALNTRVTAATLSNTSGLVASKSGANAIVTPTKGFAWGSDRTLTIVAEANNAGDIVSMTATVNVVGSAQGQTVTGPQGASFSGMVEQFQATATNDASSLDDNAWSDSHIDPTASLPYVWNREIVYILDPKTSQTTSQTTEPHICCEFADGILTHISKYAVNGSNVAPNDADFDVYGDNVAAAIAAMNSTDKRFLWNWEISTYKDESKNTSVKRLVAITGRDGAKGKDGNDGQDGVDGKDGISVSSVEERYTYGTETAPNVTWYDSALMPVDEDGKRYVWNKEIVKYSDGTSTELKPHIIARYTKDGKGISSYSTTYAATNTTAIPTSFPYSTLVQAVSHLSSNVPYLWEKEITYFTDGTNDGGEIRLIAVYGEKGDNGDDGRDGTSVQSVTELYAYGTETEVTGTWGSNALIPTNEHPYVWNKEVVTFVDADGNTTVSYLTPHIIARYANDGRGISGIDTKYAVVDSNAAPSEDKFIYTDITTAVRNMDKDHRYLWELEIVSYTSGQPTKTIRLVTMYGSSGIPGVDGADAVQPNIFGYDCNLSGYNLGNSLLHTDNGLVAYARKTETNAYFSVTIDVSKNVRQGRSYAIHGNILSPASGTMSVYFVASSASSSSVVKDSKTSFHAVLTSASSLVTIKITPNDSTYSGCFELSNLKIEDITDINGVKTAFDGLSNYDVPRGENMLRNTISYDGWTWHKNTTIVKNSFQGQSAVVYGSTSTVPTQFISQTAKLRAARSYTLSWWDQASDATSQVLVDIQLPDQKSGYTVVYSNISGVAKGCPDNFPRVQYNVSSEWTYRTLRFKAIGDADVNVRFWSVGRGTFYMSKPKLEEGDCDTEWIESPEDRKGMDGCIIRPRGEWDASTYYINESVVADPENTDGIRYIDVVQFDDGSTSAYYQRNSYSDGYDVGIPPTNERYWTKADTMDFVATKVLMSEEAWIRTLTGKSMLVTDSSGTQVTAGIQSVGDNTNPQIFAGANENNANNAKFRVYPDGRVVLELVDINSEDKDHNKVRVNDGSVQFIAPDGTIKTTISQLQPTDIDDVMPKDDSEDASISMDSVGFSKSQYQSYGTVQYTETTSKTIASVNTTGDGGLFIIPSIDISSYMYSQKPPTAGAIIGRMSKKIELLLNGIVLFSESHEMYISLTNNSTLSTETKTFGGYKAPAIKGSTYSLVLRETTSCMVSYNSPTMQTYMPSTSSNSRVSTNNVYISVSYANYLNKILGNGFVFQSAPDKFFSYINSVDNTKESMRIGQGSFRMRLNNQKLEISNNGGSSYWNNNPLAVVFQISGGDSQSKVTVLDVFQNKYGLTIENGSSSTTGKVTFKRNSVGSYSFYHMLGNVAIQIMPYYAGAMSVSLTYLSSNTFNVGFYSGTTQKDPISFFVYIYEK